MTLIEYWTEMNDAQRADFCEHLDRAPLYVLSIARQHKDRRASAALAIQIEELTAGAVTRWSLRPDLWPAPARANGKNKTKPKKRTTRATA